MADCGDLDPTTGAVCTATGMHRYHSGAYMTEVSGRRMRRNTSWLNEDWVGPNAAPTRAQQEGDLNDLAHRIRPGVPEEATEAWSKEAWTEQTYQTFVRFVAERTEPFTTAEDFWPLIDAPREKRAMTIVVQRALRAGLIIEVGAKRLDKVYRSRDGVEFAMNKFAPIYSRR